jgi:hypothetical protein
MLSLKLSLNQTRRIPFRLGVYLDADWSIHLKSERDPYRTLQIWTLIGPSGSNLKRVRSDRILHGLDRNLKENLKHIFALYWF